ncbi:MAG: PhoH family protein [Candidatus Brocadiia bacterium]|nr:PhoH family protein [Candidatus Brocadiia bacterium]
MERAAPKLTHRLLTFDSEEAVIRVLGPRDSFLRQVRAAFEVRMVARGRHLSIEGPDEPVEGCERVLRAMQERIDGDEPLDAETVDELIRDQKQGFGVGAARGLLLTGGCTAGAVGEEGPDHLEAFLSGRIARPKTQGQAEYIRAIVDNDIVFCTGPAGTGKTYLAVAVALHYLRLGELRRIVLCRPAVEVGEHLGFLPGDIRAKVNPYLRPLYDALHDLMDPAQVRKCLENDVIEILPLAFVRGRTLDRAFIILDEAQNCTIDQMKTFLTRLGVTAKLVVTGDITQVDLPPEKQSGLVDVQGRLGEICGIRFVRLAIQDIVRHRLVRDIVNAYQKESAGQVEPPTERTGDA